MRLVMARIRGGLSNDLLVTEMNSIEHSDCNTYPAWSARQSRSVSDNVHGGLTDRRLGNQLGKGNDSVLNVGEVGFRQGFQL